MTQIAIVGEAYGEAEEKAQTPFVGAAGFQLTAMLDDAGIRRADCFLTNVFNLRPPQNKIEAFCGPKADGLEGYPGLAKGYVDARYQPELQRLAGEISSVNPNIIIALGATAMWAFMGKTQITKYRGTTELSKLTAVGYKVLPTYHPSYIIRGAWAERPIVVMDLLKAARESEYPELRRPHREIWIEPTLEDLHDFAAKFIKDRVACDIETSGNQITCVGFAPTPAIGLVVPFHDARRVGRSYWRSASDERQAWAFVQGICADPGIRKSFQNGLYDIAFLWRSMGIKVLSAQDDTMLLHHALYPESLKSLGFLASLYCDETAWKQLREKTATIKREA